jgi:hypothetical protein
MPRDISRCEDTRSTATRSWHTRLGGFLQLAAKIVAEAQLANINVGTRACRRLTLERMLSRRSRRERPKDGCHRPKRRSTGLPRPLAFRLSNRPTSRHDASPNSTRADYAWVVRVEDREEAAKDPPWVCAVERRRFPVGVRPTRQPLHSILLIRFPIKGLSVAFCRRSAPPRPAGFGE